MADPKPTPREYALQMAAKGGPPLDAPPLPEVVTPAAPATPPEPPPEAAPLAPADLGHTGPQQLTAGLEARGLTEADVAPTAPPAETTPKVQDAPPENSIPDTIRATQQFQTAAHHIALMGMHTADQIAGMDPTEVFRLGAIAGERVRESSVQRQQLAEARKTGEVARAPEGGDAVPDPELAATLRKDLEPVFEALGARRGEEMVQAALRLVTPEVRTPPLPPPAPVAPDPTVAAEVARVTRLQAQIQAARAELIGTFPQLASDASMSAVESTAEALASSHTFASLKDAIEAGAMALFGKPEITRARESATRVQTEASRRLATPEPPSGARRSATAEAQLTPEQARFRRFMETSKLIADGKEQEVRARLGG